MHTLTSSLHKTMRFPVTTFPFILLCQERKKERATLKHIATSKQHHYVFDKKNPHCNMCVFYGKEDAPHFNNTADNAKVSLSVWYHGEVYYYQVHSMRRVSGPTKRNPRFPLHLIGSVKSMR